MKLFLVSFITLELNKYSKLDWYSEVFIEEDCDETYEAPVMIATACIINVSSVNFNILLFIIVIILLMLYIHINLKYQYLKCNNSIKKYIMK